MKKTFFAAAAVLLAVLLVTCDNFGPPPVVDNSEGLIISFSTDDGTRALTTPIAKAGADFFEVVFDNGTTKVRTSWGGGATGRIIPGNGDYDNSGAAGKGYAYIFAGRNDGTLLGVGHVTSVKNGASDTPGAVIDMSTATEVSFTITALNTDVGGTKNPANTGGNGPNPATSTFKIPSATFTGSEVATLLLDASQVPNLTAPVFIANLNPSTVGATFTITNTAGVELTSAVLNAIIPTANIGDPVGNVTVGGYLWERGGSPFAETTGVITTEVTETTTTGMADPLALPIALDITPGIKAGLAQLSIDIPVYLYSSDAGTGKHKPADNGAPPLVWYIKNGLNNTAADQGAAFNDGDGSLGGAILIGVGTYQKNQAGLIIRFVTN